MSNRSPALLIGDILASGAKIVNYTEGLSFKEFVDNPMVLDAVIRNFEIIGEAANRLPVEFRDNYSCVDWRRIRGFRNRIVHDYFGVDYRIVWEIKENFLPELISQLEQIEIQ
ncbi:DUF86 domain-containing protein [Persicitalea sp.]|uniref:HepT-like ribonuclease domain-containing protein n=1 Tax=Persicitalea sp. TaxID=3100273 RepID=UPI00359356ED